MWESRTLWKLRAAQQRDEVGDDRGLLLHDRVANGRHAHRRSLRWFALTTRSKSDKMARNYQMGLKANPVSQELQTTTHRVLVSLSTSS